MKRIISVLLAVLMLGVCLFATTGCSIVEDTIGGIIKSDYDKLHDYIQETGTLTSGGYYVTTNTKSSYNYGYMLDDEDQMLWYISSTTSNGTESFLSLYVSEDSIDSKVIMSFGDTTMTACIHPATYSRSNTDLSEFQHNGYTSLSDTYEKLCSSTLSLMMMYNSDILPEGVTMEGLGFTAY